MTPSPGLNHDRVFKASAGGGVIRQAKSPEVYLTSAQILQSYHQEFLDSVKGRQKSSAQSGEQSVDSERPKVPNQKNKMISQLQVSPNFMNPFSSPRLEQNAEVIPANKLVQGLTPSTLGIAYKQFSQNSQLLQHMKTMTTQQKSVLITAPTLAQSLNLQQVNVTNDTLKKNNSTVKSIETSKLSPFLLSQKQVKNSSDDQVKTFPIVSSMAYSPSSFQSTLLLSKNPQILSSKQPDVNPQIAKKFPIHHPKPQENSQNRDPFISKSNLNSQERKQKQIIEENNFTLERLNEDQKIEENASITQDHMHHQPGELFNQKGQVQKSFEEEQFISIQNNKFVSSSNNYQLKMKNKDLLIDNTKNNREVVDSLKIHLKGKYPQYNEDQIEQLIYKFLNEYLVDQMATNSQEYEEESQDKESSYSDRNIAIESQSEPNWENPNDYILLEKDDKKVLVNQFGSFTARNQTIIVNSKEYQKQLYQQAIMTQAQKKLQNHHSDFDPAFHLPLISDENDNFQGSCYLKQNESEPDSSVTTSIIDWDDKSQIERRIERQIQKQKESIENALDTRRGIPLRMSEYFGALKVDQLNEDDEPPHKLNQLFEECFGFKLQPNKGQSEAFGEDVGSIDESQPEEIKHKPNKNQIPQQIKKEKQEVHKNSAAESQFPSISTQTFSQDPQKMMGQKASKVKDVIVQSNTVNNDQSCQIILNFYNVKCNTPKGAQQLQAVVEAAQLQKPHKIILNTSLSPRRAKLGISTTENAGPASTILSGDLKKPKLQKGFINASHEHHKVQKAFYATAQIGTPLSVMQSMKGQTKKKKGENVLTIQDQLILYDNDDTHNHFTTQKSDDFNSQATSHILPGLKSIHRSDLNQDIQFGSMIEKKQFVDNSPSSIYKMTSLKNNTSNFHQDEGFKGFEMSYLYSNPQSTTQANSKQFFKSILYKNQNLSLNQQKLNSITDQASPDQELVVLPQGSYANLAQNINTFKLKQKSSAPLNVFPSQLKMPPLNLVDAKQLQTTSEEDQKLNSQQQQRMYTAISSSTMNYNNNQINESQERNTSAERSDDNLISTMKTLNAQQKLKAKKIGSIISMKALRNDLLGIASSINASQKPKSYVTQYAIQKSAAQSTALQNLKKGRPTRNHGLLPPTLQSQHFLKQYKSYQEPFKEHGNSPSSDFEGDLIKLKFRGGGNTLTEEEEDQRSSRTRKKYHHTSNSVDRSDDQHSANSMDHLGSAKGSRSHRSQKAIKGVGMGQKQKDNLNHNKHLKSYNHVLTGSPTGNFSTKFGFKNHRPESSIQRDQTAKNVGHYKASITPMTQLGGNSPRYAQLHSNKMLNQSRNNPNIKMNTQTNIAQINHPNTQIQGKPPKRYLSPSVSLNLHQQQQKALQKIYFPKGQKDTPVVNQFTQSMNQVLNHQNHHHPISVPHSYQSLTRPVTRFYNSVTRQTPRNNSKESNGSKQLKYETNYQQLQNLKQATQTKYREGFPQNHNRDLEQTLGVSQIHPPTLSQDSHVKVLPQYSIDDQNEINKAIKHNSIAHQRDDQIQFIAVGSNLLQNSTASSNNPPFFYVQNSGVSRAAKTKKKSKY